MLCKKAGEFFYCIFIRVCRVILYAKLLESGSTRNILSIKALRITFKIVQKGNYGKKNE